MDYLISDKRSNRRAASGDRVRGRGGGSPYSPIDRAPPPFKYLLSLKIWIFPSLQFSLTSSYNLEKKHEFAKNWYPMLCFLSFFFGGGGAREQSSLYSQSRVSHWCFYGTITLIKLRGKSNMISAKTLSDFAPFSSVFQKKKKKKNRQEGPRTLSAGVSVLSLWGETPKSCALELNIGTHYGKKKLKKNGKKETNLQSAKMVSDCTIFINPPKSPGEVPGFHLQEHILIIMFIL